MTRLKLLGYLIQRNELRPDPDRLRTLLELPYPTNLKELKRLLGFFSYYSKWISNYADKIQPLNRLLSLSQRPFSLDENSRKAFELMKQDIAGAARATIDEDVPFTVETDASFNAVGATLNQGGRPVAFYSRTLTKSERNYPAVEKEACAIVESLKRWRHYLLEKKFILLTDQRSVSFMFDPQSLGKIKNEKIARWRVELSCFVFDINYREGKQNLAADLLSRTYNCAVHSESNLMKLHSDLCHPGVSRFYHFIRSRNLPYSMEDVKNIVRSCSICAKVKPTFGIKSSNTLIKATQPFERLSIDFKGPLPSTTGNRYLLTVVDEYSRFPFAFPCSDLTSRTVIENLCQLFSIFGMPSYLHSDRGTSFMSQEIKEFLSSRGVCLSQSTPYNPQGNGQIERYNGVIWKTLELAAASRNIQIKQMLLPDALHSIRSLLCTSTNETPHERLFRFQRRSVSGTAVPTWLTSSKKVLLKRFVRESKYEPLADEVELLDANPTYAKIRHSDGRESTVSLKHLAPLPEESAEESTVPLEHSTPPDTSAPIPIPNSASSPPTAPFAEETDSGQLQEQHLRRSSRIRRPPDRLQYK